MTFLALVTFHCQMRPSKSLTDLPLWIMASKLPVHISIQTWHTCLASHAYRLGGKSSKTSPIRENRPLVDDHLVPDVLSCLSFILLYLALDSAHEVELRLFDQSQGWSSL